MNFYFEDRFSCVLPEGTDAAWAESVITPALFNMAHPVIRTGDENVIRIGSADIPELADGEAAILTTPAGITIRGKDHGALMRGLMTVLLNADIDYKVNKLYRPCGTEVLRPAVKMRALHLCVFPETEKEELKKWIRLAGMLRYSHLIVEFWGMLHYEIPGVPLGWKNAMSMTEAKAILDEARAYGLEIIPMFNHLGHASACRLISGKHVVLDQAPELSSLFKAYGWEWNITDERVYKLLGEIRRKLISVSGDGAYFHLGCDEAYSFGYGDNRSKELCDFLSRIIDETEMKGRRGIIWGDMLQLKKDYEDAPEKYSFNVTDPAITKTLLEHLDRRLIVADWQYHQTGECWRSSEAFRKEGFDVWCCPWDYDARMNVRSALQTVRALDLDGVIHTTWHTTDHGVPLAVYAGLASYTGDLSAVDNHTRLMLFAAQVLRKVNPHPDYRHAGFHLEQIHLQ